MLEFAHVIHALLGFFMPTFKGQISNLVYILCDGLTPNNNNVMNALLKKVVCYVSLRKYVLSWK